MKLFTILLAFLLFINLISCNSGNNSSPSPKSNNQNPVGDEGKKDPSKSIDGSDSDPVTPPIIILEPITIQPLPTYVPLTSQFSNPFEIVKDPNIESVLFKLRQIASPTKNYHDDLYNLIVSVKTIDFDHLNLLLDAIYYPVSYFIESQKEFETIINGKTQDERLRKAYLDRDIKLASFFGRYTVNFLIEGLDKLNNYSLDQAIILIQKIYPQYSTDLIFYIVLKKFPNITKDKKYELMYLADSKLASETAASIAFEIFKEYTNKDLNAVIDLAKSLNYTSKDRFLFLTVPTFEKLTLEDAIKITLLTYSEFGKIGALAYGKTSPYSHTTVLQMSQKLPKNQIGTFFLNVLKFYNQLSINELIELLKQAEDHQNEIALKAFEKLIDLTPSKSLEVTQVLTYNSKDTWMLKCVEKLPSLTSADVLNYISLAYDSKSAIATSAFVKIVDLNITSALKIASELSYNSKDNWIKLFLDKKISSISTPDALKFIKLSYDSASQIAMSLVDKLTDLNFKNSLSIAEELTYNAKDNWLKVVLINKIQNLTTDELVLYLKTSYDSKSQFASIGLNKVSDFNLKNGLKIAEELTYNSKDIFLKTILNDKVQLINTSELIKYMEASYDSRYEFTIIGLNKLSDLSPANALKIVELLTFNAKDQWLDKSYEKFAKLTSAEIYAAMESSYDSSLRLSLKLIEKATDFNVNNAIKISSLLTFNSKDQFLLKSIDLVSDLDSQNLENLVAASYNAEIQIREKGKKKIRN